MLQDIRRQGLGKSGLKFRHEGGGNLKWPKKFRRLLWTAPYHLQVIDEKFSTNLQIIEAGITKDKKNQEHCMNIIMNTITFHSSQKLKMTYFKVCIWWSNCPFQFRAFGSNCDISKAFISTEKKIHLLSFFSYKKKLLFLRSFKHQPHCYFTRLNL